MDVFSVEEVGNVSEAFFLSHGRDETWAALRGKTLSLPGWFVKGLDPFSTEYAEQQHRLWQEISGIDRDYQAELDENLAENPNDVIRLPGYYLRRHATAVLEAGQHVTAMGAFMSNSNLSPGQWALEYGAGYGLIALSFARMGVNVDTVDISKEFCHYVKQQADFYKVPLTPYNAQFGEVPRSGQKYDLIYFFESLHHCTALQPLMVSLKQNLTNIGRVIIAGEPIHTQASPAIPYPWGMRLDSSTVAVVRRRRWFELGFTEDFISELFTRYGFVTTPMPGVSAYDRGYIFTHRPQRLDMATHWLPHVQSLEWYPADKGGRWTRARSSIHLDTHTSQSVVVEAVNHHSVEQLVKFTYAGTPQEVLFAPGQRRAVALTSSAGDKSGLKIECEPLVPAKTGTSNDPRPLGIYIVSVSYGS